MKSGHREEAQVDVAIATGLNAASLLTIIMPNSIDPGHPQP